MSSPDYDEVFLRDLDDIDDIDDIEGIDEIPESPKARKEDEKIVGDFAYSLTDLIGHGEPSLIYKGRRISDNLRVAVKVLPKKNMWRSVSHETRQEIMNTELIMELDHPNIVKLYGAKETEDAFYLFLEYCNQLDLNTYLVEMKTFTETTIRYYLRQIADALKYLSDKGLVHRDLTPANIMLHSNSKCPAPVEMTVKISNLALTRKMHEGGAAMQVSYLGGNGYTAPEAAGFGTCDIKADLWSVGALAYRCFTGTIDPITAGVEEYNERDNIIVIPRPIGISDGLWNLISGLLHYDPIKRFDMGDFYNHPFIQMPSNESSDSSDDDDSQTLVSQPHVSYADTACARSPPQQRVHEESAPATIEGARFAQDSDDLIVGDFVLVPIAESSNGTKVDPYFDPVNEVVLPCVRKSKSEVVKTPPKAQSKSASVSKMSPKMSPKVSPKSLAKSPGKSGVKSLGVSSKVSPKVTFAIPPVKPVPSPRKSPKSPKSPKSGQKS